MGRNVPQLRFPEFTAEWEEKTLGDIFTFYSTNSLSRDKLNYTGGPYKNIHYGDIHMIFPTVLNVSETEIPYINEGVKVKVTEDNFVVDGDIAIADASEDYADIGKAIEIIGVGDEKLVCGLHTLHGRDLNKVMVNGFKGYLLRTPKVRRQMMTLCAGAKVLGISKDNINSVSIMLPSKEEQEKIKNLLVAYDKLIRNQEEKISALKERKQGLLKKIFTQQVRFKDQDGNDYPAWEEKTLGDICTGFEYGMNESAVEYNGQHKYIRITDIDEDTHKFIDGNVSPEKGICDKYRVTKNSILFARTGASTGKTYLYNENDGELYYAGFLIMATVKNEYNSYFVYSQTLTERYKQWVSVMSVRSGQPGINAQEYKTYKIYSPCKEEQDKIAEVLSAFDKKIEIEQEILSNMQEFKKGLLQKMFI